MFVIPSDRLPPGFAERIERPPAEPSVPVPAATTVLLRAGENGPEILLLRRHRTSGFVPGAYVFPGGRVDPEDGEPGLLARTDLGDGAADLRDGAAAPEYRMAAVRELFEETGVLLAGRDAGHAVGDAAADPRLADWREALMQGRSTLLDLIDSLDLRLAAADLVYCAHWITPVAERRRYDTRFFLAALPPGAEASIDGREMTDALWLTPAAALRRFRAGRLPMVFPTVRTLETLEGFTSVAAALDAHRYRAVASVLPRLVRTAEGVGIVVDGGAA